MPMLVCVSFFFYRAYHSHITFLISDTNHNSELGMEYFYIYIDL